MGEVNFLPRSVIVSHFTFCQACHDKTLKKREIAHIHFLGFAPRNAKMRQN